jgi:sulfatase maturation enzyme AslB (radical SAM superfamily)
MLPPSPRIWVWLDVSATCNLACRDCYTKHAHEGHLMSSAQFRIILQKLNDAAISLQKIHLNWRGEPLTNKRIVDFLRMRREILPTVELEFHTNGLLLNPRLCEEIIFTALDSDLFYVSIDGGRREAHEGNRGVGTWDDTLRGLRMFLDARDRRKVGSPRVGIYEIFYGDRSPYDPELVALSRRCDEWNRVAPVQTCGAEASHDTRTVPDGPCFWAGHAFCVTARGDVHVCLLSFRPDGRLGNLLTEDLQPILDKATSFRAGMIENGRLSQPHCRSCRKGAGEPNDP